MMAFAFYIVKVILCSGVFFLYYFFALRNRSFHQWNRFYLLFSVLVSLVIPSLHFTVIQPLEVAENKVIHLLNIVQSVNDHPETNERSIQQGFGSGTWLLVVYWTTSISLLSMMVFSIIKLFRMARVLPVKRIEGIRIVSTIEPRAPFSFFHFIFWNEEIDLASSTGQQIFRHEMVHVKERHSFDKVLLQILLSFFWINPFFWLFRKELKLVHEFIADREAVGNEGTAALAAMVLHSLYPARFHSLTNQFFQPSIKRRILMLSKIHNPRLKYVGRMLVLPLFALTVLAFSLRTKSIAVTSHFSDRTVTVMIDAGHGMRANGQRDGVSVEGINEDEVVLSIAKKVQALNGNEHIRILLTRNSDEIVDLHKRVDIARDNKADLFLSLHLNANPEKPEPGTISADSKGEGFEIYVSGKQPSYQQQSQLFASVLQEELKSVYSINSNLLTRKVGVWVLDKNVCPSVILECGFLTNEKDRKFIENESNQQIVAARILSAIGRYAANLSESK
jgi:N-acetylmuramoyl-L-alanine amidase